MALAQYTPIRANLNYQLPFRRPILNFEGMGAAYFEMVYDCLNGKFAVNPSDFSARNSNNLAEVSCKYSVFGGTASVTMQSDKLAFEFPGVLPSDLPTILAIIEAIHDAFPKSFPLLHYERVEAQSYNHLELNDVTTVEGLLNRFAFPSSPDNALLANTVQRPTGKLDLTAADSSWHCTCSMERSVAGPKAVFVVMTLSLYNMSSAIPFVEKLTRAREIATAVLGVIGLEPARAP